MLLRSGRSKVDSLPGGSESASSGPQRRHTRTRSAAAAKGSPGPEESSQEPGRRPERLYPDLSEVSERHEIEAVDLRVRGRRKIGERPGREREESPFLPTRPRASMETWGAFTSNWWSPMPEDPERGGLSAEDPGRQPSDRFELEELEARRARTKRAERLAAGAALLEERRRSAEAEDEVRRRRQRWAAGLDLCGRLWKFSQQACCRWTVMVALLAAMFVLGWWAGK